MALAVGISFAALACSSAGPSGATSGAGGDDATAGAGGATGAGGAGGDVQSTGQGGAGAGAGSCEPDPSPDSSCTTADAKTGATCTKHCCIQCGFGGIGNKFCTCRDGIYSMCPCVPPDTWHGPSTAPTCPTADGTTTTLKNTLCSVEWQACVGTDPVSGSTPQGCVCMNNPATSRLQWYCGSTNKWFTLSQ